MDLTRAPPSSLPHPFMSDRTSTAVGKCGVTGKRGGVPAACSCCCEECKRLLKFCLVCVFWVWLCASVSWKNKRRQYRCISAFLSFSLSEPNMKQRKQPLWSLPACQSALHRDCMLRLLMCCTGRSETRMQTQRHGGVAVEGVIRGRRWEGSSRLVWLVLTSPRS